MKCETTNLEIETIYVRIKNGDINLQPDFQRGEVWSPAKKKKLIDSIFRAWKIPPIHVVNVDSAVDEVLDGQQRLVTIVECKATKAPLDKAITEKWIKNKIPDIYGAIRKKDSTKKIEFQLWSVGGYDQDSVEMLKKAQNSTNKYGVEYYDKSGILDIARQSKSQVIMKHIIKNYDY